MNLPTFAVITIRERETPFRDDIRPVEGLGRERPAPATALTISMLALAGLPGTAGFIGKLFLIEASVEGDYTWLGVMIVIGTMISLAYYLRVIAAMWMQRSAERPAAATPAMAGGSQEADAQVTGARCPAIIGLTLLCAAATVFFGFIPDPLVDFAESAGESIGSLLG
jgi:NADH-quinone oxidoreductase subunit N